MVASSAQPTPHIRPFWEDIPRIFKYPAQKEALLTVALFSVLWVLALLPGLIGLIFAIIMSIATYRFAYTILAHTAKGHMEPPGSYFEGVNDSIFWQQLGLWLLMIGIVALAAYSVNASFALLVGIFMLIGLPIATMVLAIDQSVWRAINPMIWLDGMRRIGWPYAIVSLFLLLLIVSSGVLQQYLAPALPFLLGYIAAQFISIYFLVAMFFLLGYVIYQYHDALGWDIDVERLTPSTNNGKQAPDPLVLEAEHLVTEGRAEEAKRLLKAQVTSAGPLSAVTRYYLELVKATQDHAALLAIGEHQIACLLELDRDHEALQLAQRCLNADPRFQLNSGMHVYRLAQAAQQRAQAKLVIRLTNGFAKRYPGHRATVRVFFLVAQVLGEKLGQDEKAQAILKQLEDKYPQHELIEEIREYRLVLASVSQGRSEL